MNHTKTTTSSISTRCTKPRGIFTLSLLACTLAACTTSTWLENAVPQLPERDRTPAQANVTDEDSNQKSRFYQTPAAPERRVPPAQAIAPFKPVNEPGKEATVAFDGIPLPQFITSVYGVILKKTIALDPQIQQRRDLVSMRAGKPQTTSQLYESAKAVLRAYGVSIQELPGLTRFVPDNATADALPEIRRGRAMPEVPETLRPQFHLVEIENVQSGSITGTLQSIFREKVTIVESGNRNAIMLSGTAQNVSAAMQAILALDQPLMRGRLSARISPAYWSADELTRRINEILLAEGYASGTQSGSTAPAIMLPISPINSVIVFASNQALLDHILKWAEELDQPTQTRSGNYFIYPVRHADAADIAATLSQVLGTSSTGTTGTTGQTASAAQSSRIVVNKATNSLILQASPAEYQQWLSLLQELDRPAKSALVTISVADVRIQDGENFGFEWLVNNLKIGGFSSSLSTIGSWGTSGLGGMALNIGGTSPTAILNALARSSQARVLSNPSILTRSGEDASITIGQEVPIITSSTTSTSTTSVVQTIQYRNTGVIMKVKPVVRAGGRIDLTVTQEVSSANEITSGGVQSPTFSTRKLDTKLTVRDGNTVVLGGLMSDNRDNSDTGVPYAKDIPYLGNLFKASKKSTDRTELVMLITAYAIEDDFDVESITEAFRKRFPWTEPLYRSTTATPEPISAPPSARVTQSTAKPYVRSVVTEDVPYTTATSAPYVLPSGTQSANSQLQQSPETQGTLPAPVKKGPTVPLPTGGQGSLLTNEELKKELLQAVQSTGKP